MKSTSTCSKYVCRYIATYQVVISRLPSRYIATYQVVILRLRMSLYCDLPSRYIATSYVVILRLRMSLYCDLSSLYIATSYVVILRLRMSLYCDLPSRYIATSYVVILRLLSRYIATSNSLYCDFQLVIKREVVRYSLKGNVLICGDMNARTGILKDYAENDSDLPVDIPLNYTIDQEVPRQSKDTSVNPQGRVLLDLCISARMRIVNGRTQQKQWYEVHTKIGMISLFTLSIPKTV